MVAEYAILRVCYFTSLRRSSANWFRRSDNTDVIPLRLLERQLFRFPDDFQWLPPWIELPDDYATLIPISWPDDQQLAIGRDAIVAELRREIPGAHVLCSMELDAVAVHVECGYKDFVFTTNDPVNSIAVVHLTYNVESDPKWPATRLVRGLDEWMIEMNLDYEQAGKPNLDCRDGHYKLIQRQIENQTKPFCARCGEGDVLPRR